jgi:hypothetical protein
MNMSSLKPIGGYFELELPGGSFLYKDGIFLNSARNCLAYILKAQQARRLFIPKYTCDVLIEPLERLMVEPVFYNIDEDLQIKSAIDLRDGDYLLYTNYFGVKDKYIHQLAAKYQEKLIIDNAQALYFEPINPSHTFYSPRKFFGLPDGGVLFTDKILAEELPRDISHQRSGHLLKRLDIGPEAGYEDFKADDASLIGEPIKQMSALTKRILQSIDYNSAKQKRLENLKFLDERLRTRNLLKIETDSTSGPLCYPLLTNDKDLKQKLIAEKIFVPTYWPNVLDWCQPNEFEYHLAEAIVALPIDQRYGLDEMKRVAEAING